MCDRVADAVSRWRRYLPAARAMCEYRPWRCEAILRTYPVAVANRRLAAAPPPPHAAAPLAASSDPAPRSQCGRLVHGATPPSARERAPVTPAAHARRGSVTWGTRRRPLRHSVHSRPAASSDPAPRSQCGRLVHGATHPSARQSAPMTPAARASAQVRGSKSSEVDRHATRKSILLKGLRS